MRLAWEPTGNPDYRYTQEDRRENLSRDLLDIFLDRSLEILTGPGNWLQNQSGRRGLNPIAGPARSSRHPFVGSPAVNSSPPGSSRAAARDPPAPRVARSLDGPCRSACLPPYASCRHGSLQPTAGRPRLRAARSRSAATKTSPLRASKALRFIASIASDGKWER